MAKIIDFPVDRARPPRLLTREEKRFGELLFKYVHGRKPRTAAEKAEARGDVLAVSAELAKAKKLAKEGE
ncbi:hypothetical protein [Lysobacter enzymogenes]|uniref:hypothetical protein n=1 Tax=Lysobacter enzymogenes TaxID=69 RepID=UPI00099D3DED|nr:hypothetical protein [Lysobacter enzymogenes]UZW62354.1 hypothetical protein BV903_008730 [Lysobacter enzymogenes]